MKKWLKIIKRNFSIKKPSKNNFVNFNLDKEFTNTIGGEGSCTSVIGKLLEEKKQGDEAKTAILETRTPPATFIFKVPSLDHIIFDTDPDNVKKIEHWSLQNRESFRDKNGKVDFRRMVKAYAESSQDHNKNT